MNDAMTLELALRAASNISEIRNDDDATKHEREEVSWSEDRRKKRTSYSLSWQISLCKFAINRKKRVRFNERNLYSYRFVNEFAGFPIDR